MIGGKQRRIVESRAQHVFPQIRDAIVQLAEAYDYARGTHRDRWDFAVEIDRLMALGLTASDLRWLTRSGYAEQAREVTKLADAARVFLPGRDRTFTKKTCFVLTDAGLLLTTTEPAVAPLRRAA